MSIVDDPRKLSAGAQRDMTLKPQIARVFALGERRGLASGPGHPLVGQAGCRVGAVAVTLPDGSQPDADPVASNPYVLPGAQRHWIVHAAAASLRLRITARSGESEQGLAIEDGLVEHPPEAVILGR